MARPPAEQFGKRRLPPLEPSSPPMKRSGRVALLVMGTLAVGGGAYALMPHGNCDPNRPGVATAATSGQTSTACSSRSSSSGGHGGGWASRSGFYGGDSSSSRSSSGTSSESGSGITRGGFGGFAHAISAHFSGGS
ncbi:MAG: hypothetical protein ABI150_07680 [Nitrobacter sp.]|jgi:hypothetical protein